MRVERRFARKTTEKSVVFLYRKITPNDQVPEGTIDACSKELLSLKEIIQAWEEQGRQGSKK